MLLADSAASGITMSAAVSFIVSFPLLSTVPPPVFSTFAWSRLLMIWPVVLSNSVSSRAVRSVPGIPIWAALVEQRHR